MLEEEEEDWKRFPLAPLPSGGSRNAVACGGRKKTIPFSRRKRVLPPSAITGARVEYTMVYRVRTVWRGEKTPSCSSSSVKINLVVSILERRKKKLFLLYPSCYGWKSVGESLPLSIPRKSSPKYMGIMTHRGAQAVSRKPI